MLKMHMKSPKFSYMASCCKCRRNQWILRGVLLIADQKLSPEGVSSREGLMCEGVRATELINNWYSHVMAEASHWETEICSQGARQSKQRSGNEPSAEGNTVEVPFASQGWPGSRVQGRSQKPEVF